MGALILTIAAVFLLCYLVDKGFTKVFRGKVQHQSGKSVRLSKRYGSIGTIMFALGVAAAFMGGNNAEWALLVGGCILVLMGIALVVYYLSFGIYYDEDSLIFSKFGKPTKTYYFKNIRCQQLYVVSGNIVVELHMNDGTTVAVQGNMEGAPSFLDKAAHARMRQLMLNSHECQWFDETEGRWFPPVEE